MSGASIRTSCYSATDQYTLPNGSTARYATAGHRVGRSPYRSAYIAMLVRVNAPTDENRKIHSIILAD